MPLIRLNKLLAERGIASRREADRLIEAGQVKVNGKVVTEMGVKVDPEVDEIEVSEAVLKERENLIYIALNKPKGYVCSAKPTRFDPKIVLDLIDLSERIYPVGRLDKDSTGLLVLTNDGTLTHKLIHPSSECEKEYEVLLKGAITKGAIQKLEAGVKLQSEKTLPTRVKRIKANVIHITLTEGKNRQVRRICQKVGYPVKELRRIRIKNLKLGNLKPGKWRFLSAKEVEMLKS